MYKYNEYVSNEYSNFRNYAGMNCCETSYNSTLMKHLHAHSETDLLKESILLLIVASS